MRYFALLFLVLSFSFAFPQRRNEFQSTSHEKPTSDLPVDWHILSQAAGMAQEPYCFFDDIGRPVGDAKVLWSEGFGLVIQRVKILHSKSLGITVSFEGTTSSLLSSVHDVELILLPPPKEMSGAFDDGSRLFHGFVNAYMEVRDSTYKMLRKYMKEYNDDRVTLTGHSLGAAMALIAGMDLEHRLEKGIHNVFAFGLPRTGNAAFANSVDKRIGGRFYYVVNGRDWVPRMPPRELGYQHPSGQVWINPASSTKWKFYPGQENHYGANSELPILTFAHHNGVYFHTGLGDGHGKCPASVNTEH